MRVWKSIALSILFHFVIYGILAIVTRLHLTQLAYQFYEMKAYERSLKEEQLRLRSELAKQLSPSFLDLKEFQAPDPDRVVRIP